MSLQVCQRAALGSSSVFQTTRRPSSGRRSLRPVRSQYDTKDSAAPNAAKVPKDVLEYAKTLPGISQPFPNIFDPLNFLGSAGSSNSGVRDLRRWRESEITHGRVAMLAALGFPVQEQLQDVPSRFFPHVKGPAINHFQQVESQGAIFWEPLLFAIGLAEAYRVNVGWAPPTSEDFYALRDDYEPGNLGFDPLGLLPSDPAARYELQTKELNNGRLAMISVVAFVVQEEIAQKELFAHTADKLNL